MQPKTEETKPEETKSKHKELWRLVSDQETFKVKKSKRNTKQKSKKGGKRNET